MSFSFIPCIDLNRAKCEDPTSNQQDLTTASTSARIFCLFSFLNSFSCLESSVTTSNMATHFELDGCFTNMQLQAFSTGNIADSSEKDETRYLFGEFDPDNEACVGLLCENGIFEYRDIYTLQYIRYHVVNTDNESVCRANWLHFQFVGNDCIMFTLENVHQIYKTRCRARNICNIFPNHLTERNNYGIELRFETPEVISCFDCDIKRTFVYCGLQNGDILIGAVDAPSSSSTGPMTDEEEEEEEEEEEQLILVQNCHSTTTTSICGQLLGALISSGKDQTLKIWDFVEGSDEVRVLHSLTISTDGVTALYPFRCHLSDSELLAVTTVEGIIYIYLLEEAKLLTILNTDYQSEIVDISAMSDGIILSVSTLNGFIYLFDTVNFHQVSCQRLSAKPIIFAKYRKSNNDFMFIDYEGTYRVYPQTRPNTEYHNLSDRRSSNVHSVRSHRSASHSTTSSMALTSSFPSRSTTSSKMVLTEQVPPSSTATPLRDGLITPSTATVSQFTINTPAPHRGSAVRNDRNVFSKTTISSNATPLLFQGINRRKAMPRKIVNPQKHRRVLEQIENIKNIDPKSVPFSKGKEGAISKYYRQKMEAIESEQFDASKMTINKERAEALRKEKIQKMVAEHEKKAKEQKMFGALPAIPSKLEVLKKQMKRNKKKSQKLIEGKFNNIGLEPSIKPFFKRSLQPERRGKADQKLMRMKPEKMNNRKTISFSKTLTAWSRSAYNQRF